MGKFGEFFYIEICIVNYAEKKSSAKGSKKKKLLKMFYISFSVVVLAYMFSLFTFVPVEQSEGVVIWF